MKKIKTVVYILWLIFVAVMYYISIPAANIHSLGFWSFLMTTIIIPLFILSLIFESSEEFRFGDLFARFSKKNRGQEQTAYTKKKGFFMTKLTFFLGVGIFLGVTLVEFYGTPVIHAKRYASILKIEDVDFSEDIDESQVLNKVALMDTQSARILGNRKIGSLSDVVSQFDVAYNYSQIDYKGTPLKVSALEYTGFFKYLANRSSGIPGYVTVDPVGQSTKYVKLDKGMKYVPSAYFQKDLNRHLRFAYPTAIFENEHFEIDEEGNPYYVASVMSYKVGLFNGETIKGVITCDPVSGKTQYYALKDIPTWIDMAYSGDLLVKQFDWYGTYNNGYFNSLFAKKGCRKSTETSNSMDDSEDALPDYGYIAKDGDIWIYTGVTSVNEDASNIGFIMVNERTGEAHYFSIPGADENSAMKAAQGEVQEKRYVASFPSLINVRGQATYIMLLKDANDIVKMYAMVNVEQYNQVTTGETLSECYSNYCKLLGLEENEEQAVTEETQEEDDTEELTFVVADIRFADIDGNTFVYFIDDANHIYKMKFGSDETLLLVNVGDTLKVKAKADDNGIYVMKKCEVVPVENSTEFTEN